MTYALKLSSVLCAWQPGRHAVDPPCQHVDPAGDWGGQVGVGVSLSVLEIDLAALPGGGRPLCQLCKGLGHQGGNLLPAAVQLLAVVVFCRLSTSMVQMYGKQEGYHLPGQLQHIVDGSAGK